MGLKNIEKIEEQLKKLQQKERILKEKHRKARTHALIELAAFVFKDQYADFYALLSKKNYKSFWTALNHITRIEYEKLKSNNINNNQNIENDNADNNKNFNSYDGHSL